MSKMDYSELVALQSCDNLKKLESIIISNELLIFTYVLCYLQCPSDLGVR